MASIPFLLMQEYNEESKRAAAVENYDRKLGFDTAESTVNNFLHGNTPAVCLALTKRALNHIIEDESIDISESERLALIDATVIIDIFVSDYKLEIATI